MPRRCSASIARRSTASCCGGVSATSRWRAQLRRIARQARELLEVRHEDDLDPPILLAVLLDVVLRDRVELAVARGGEARRGEALADHELHDAVRARGRQVPVVRK